MSVNASVTPLTILSTMLMAFWELKLTLLIID
jgi:hypothetical protein